MLLMTQMTTILTTLEAVETVVIAPLNPPQGDETSHIVLQEEEIALGTIILRGKGKVGSKILILTTLQGGNKMFHLLNLEQMNITNGTQTKKEVFKTLLGMIHMVMTMMSQSEGMDVVVHLMGTTLSLQRRITTP